MKFTAQAHYKLKFNAIDALPVSDLFIAKRMQSENDTLRWKLFDAYKVNYGYGIECKANGMIIAASSADEMHVIGANFSSARRQNLKGAIVCSMICQSNFNKLIQCFVSLVFQLTCGLVVNKHCIFCT